MRESPPSPTSASVTNNSQPLYFQSIFLYPYFKFIVGGIKQCLSGSFEVLMDIPMYYAKYLNAKFYIFKINNIYNKERKFTTRGHYCYEEDSHSTKE